MDVTMLHKAIQASACHFLRGTTAPTPYSTNYLIILVHAAATIPVFPQPKAIVFDRINEDL